MTKIPMLGNLKKKMGMGVCRIVEQVGKADLKNQAKTVTLEKWLTMTSN
jgi:hypothetical protein